MKKAIVYASTTGNTKAMANAIIEGAKESGAEVYSATADSADQAEVLSADLIFFGSPAMGEEVLEDSLEDFYNKIEGSLNGKRVAIFGSYDWGDGQWLRDWADRLTAAGATLVNGQGLMCNLTPDAEGLEECKKLGQTN